MKVGAAVHRLFAFIVAAFFLAAAAGAAPTLKAPVAYEKYMDESFAKAARPAAIAL